MLEPEEDILEPELMEPPLLDDAEAEKPDFDPDEPKPPPESRAFEATNPLEESLSSGQ